MSNIERASRERVKRLIHDARERQLEVTGVARFFERERQKKAERELRERGEPVDD